jgi:ribonuclease HI
MGFDDVMAGQLPALELGPLVAYTDGSCLNNGQTSALGGYSVVFVENPDAYFAWNMDDGLVPTNNRAEFYGWLAACGVADKLDEVNDAEADAPARRRTLVIHTDSMYVVNTVNTWLSGWAKNDYAKKTGESAMNLDLLKRVEAQLLRRAIKTVHVKAHTGGEDLDSKANSRADSLARWSAEHQQAVLGPLVLQQE